MWQTLVGGASAISQPPQTNIFLPFSYSQPVYKNERYVFSDLKITVNKPGSYQILAMVEGIESKRSGILTIENKVASQLESVCNEFRPE